MKNLFIRNSRNGRKLPPVYAPFTKTDLLLSAIVLFLIIALWGVTFWLYQIAPDVIPTHFNIHMEADGWGSKDTLYNIAILGTAIEILLLISTRFSSRYFNFFVKVNERNIWMQHYLAVRMMQSIAIIMGLIMLMIPFTMVPEVLTIPSAVIWILFIILFSCLFITLFVFMWLSHKYK